MKGVDLSKDKRPYQHIILSHQYGAILNLQMPMTTPSPRLARSCISHKSRKTSLPSETSSNCGPILFKLPELWTEPRCRPNLPKICGPSWGSYVVEKIWAECLSPVRLSPFLLSTA